MKAQYEFARFIAECMKEDGFEPPVMHDKWETAGKKITVYIMSLREQINNLKYLIEKESKK